MARDIELRAVENTFRWYGELADKLYDKSPRGLIDAVALVSREPVGVVAAITPWNFPLTLSSWKIAPALLAGNSMVIKPATQSPLSLLRLAQLGSAAGLPDGVLQVVTGSGGQAGAALARHNGVDCLTFTGSPDVGKQLLIYAGESNAKPVHLELGGKSPQLVFADAPDLAVAARTVAWAITFNAGQMCTAGARLFVEETIADQFVAEVVSEIKRCTVGDPFDPDTHIGPVASRAHRADVLEHARTAHTEGATLAHGSLQERAGRGRTWIRSCSPMFRPSTACSAKKFSDRSSQSPVSLTTLTPSGWLTPHRSVSERGCGRRISHEPIGSRAKSTQVLSG